MRQSWLEKSSSNQMQPSVRSHEYSRNLTKHLWVTSRSSKSTVILVHLSKRYVTRTKVESSRASRCVRIWLWWSRRCSLRRKSFTLSSAQPKIFDKPCILASSRSKSTRSFRRSEQRSKLKAMLSVWLSLQRLRGKCRLTWRNCNARWNSWLRSVIIELQSKVRSSNV